MTENTLFVGLDVHKKTIAVAIAESGPGAEVRFYGTIENTPEALRALCRKLAKESQRLHYCYEAGPFGYGVRRRLTELGHRCDVVAPSLIPRRAGDRVKTDRRDAMMLVQTLRAGQLTEVWVLDEAHEAMRDLVRLRAQAMRDLRRARQYLLYRPRFLRHRLEAYGASAAGQRGMVACQCPFSSHMARQLFQRLKGLRFSPPPFMGRMVGREGLGSQPAKSVLGRRCCRHNSKP